MPSLQSCHEPKAKISNSVTRVPLCYRYEKKETFINGNLICVVHPAYPMLLQTEEQVNL